MNQTMREMPKYKSHKIVHALKIKDVNVEDGTIWIVPEDGEYAAFQVNAAYYDKHKPQAGGYYVAYDDGYKSWSPAEAFEKGYSKLENADSPLSALQSALKADEGYAWTWLCNLACIGFDIIDDMRSATEKRTPHEVANRSAAQFMKNAFDVDVKTISHWKNFEEKWAEATVPPHLPH